MQCKSCGGDTTLTTSSYITYFAHQGKSEKYESAMNLYSCSECGYSWWDDTLPDPITDAVRQYIAKHGIEDREAKKLMGRFKLVEEE